LKVQERLAAGDVAEHLEGSDPLSTVSPGLLVITSIIGSEVGHEKDPK
jgi:hypothetical protein